jgi:hypothetical protein
MEVFALNKYKLSVFLATKLGVVTLAYLWLILGFVWLQITAYISSYKFIVFNSKLLKETLRLTILTPFFED